MSEEKVLTEETPVVENEKVEETTNNIIDDTFKEAGEMATEIIEQNITQQKEELPVVEEPVVEEPVTEEPVVDLELEDEKDSNEDEKDSNEELIVLDEDAVDTEIKSILKANHNYSYLACSRHIKNEITNESLKLFYTEFVSYGIQTADDARLIELFKAKFD